MSRSNWERCYNCDKLATNWCFFCSKPLCSQHVMYVKIAGRVRTTCNPCYIDLVEKNK